MLVQDGLLQLTLQALDEDGRWKNIEFLTQSRCGNSYYFSLLHPQSYWKLSAPIYRGTFKTKLRFQLTNVKLKDQTRGVVYSNEIDGSINPAQFLFNYNNRPKLNIVEMFESF